MTPAELRTYFADATLPQTLKIVGGTVIDVPANVGMNLIRLDGDVPLLSRLAAISLNEIAEKFKQK